MNEVHEPSSLCLRPMQAVQGLRGMYPLVADAVTIGRHPSNEINIPVDSVSRFHARIERQGDSYVIVDLTSSNGTYVNDRRIATVSLHGGEVITFGTVAFRCERSDQPVAAVEERSLKTPVQLVGAEQKHSHLIMRAQAGKRDIAQLKIPDALADRDELLKAYRKLTILYKLSDILRAPPDDEQLLQYFLELVFEMVPADRGALLTRDEPEGELQVRVSRTREAYAAGMPIAISRTMVDRCMEERVAILSQDATRDERFANSESILLHDIRSTMVVPMVTQNAIMGVLHLDTRESIHAFNDDDLSFVTSMANDLALYLDHRRVLEENVHSQEMAAVGEVITDLAHNIKNVLLLAEGTTKLMDRLIADGDLPRMHQTWDLTQKTIGRISTMVKEMLEYARAYHIHKSESNLNKIVRETCESFKAEFDRKGVKVKLLLDRRIEDTFLDVKGLERSLVNLLVNACEAINHDHGEITVTTQMKASGDLALMVEDNGAGIPPAKLHRIFFPMFTTKSEHGTGLGLAMVKKWVTTVGGAIRAYSTENVGTRFVIVLPCEVTTTVCVGDEGGKAKPEKPGDEEKVSAEQSER